MIDVNPELEKSLSDLDCTLVYQHPEGFNKLPVVSYYNLTESVSMSYDNEEQLQDGVVQLDIWAEVPDECGRIALEINGLLTADGWCRQFSMDIPKQSGERAYHRTMRYVKCFC
ncbi:MAG: hypothetical protein LIO59_05090 [Oscillospiraceae bacterium]|nr:hypothetical protein [Oscillospiraceae bacterium]